MFSGWPSIELAWLNGWPSVKHALFYGWPSVKHARFIVDILYIFWLELCRAHIVYGWPSVKHAWFYGWPSVKHARFIVGILHVFWLWPLLSVLGLLYNMYVSENHAWFTYAVL